MNNKTTKDKIYQQEANPLISRREEGKTCTRPNNCVRDSSELIHQ